MTDYTKLIEEARLVSGALEEYEFEDIASNGPGLLNGLADAVESLDHTNFAQRKRIQELVAENENLLSTQCDATHTTLRALRAERDALQAQLDSMTVESAASVINRVPIAPHTLSAIADGRIFKRQVTPWVEVSD